MGFQVDSTDFKSGRVPVKGLLAVVAVGLVAAALTFALTSVFDLKLTFKTIVSALVAIASFIGIIANFEDFLSFIERFTGVELRPKAKSRQVEAPKAKRLRVLAVMPRPLDAPMLMHLADPEKFIGKFQKIKAPVDIDFVRPPTFDEFHTKLKKGYDIVHFDGHGSPKTLYFEAEDCLKSEIPVEKFAEALKAVEGRRPKLIVLSACEAAGGRKSFAERLHKLTKASVVGFAKRVTIEETSAFSERLYEELGSGKTLGEAFDSAVDALREKHPDAAKAARLFGKRSLRLLKPGLKGKVRVEAVDWFKVPNPLQTPIFVGVMTGDRRRPGRFDMVRDIVRQLRDVSTRRKLILLYGDGGFGKTALAYEAARRLAPNFRGGVLWFDGRGKAEVSLDTFLDGTFEAILGTEFKKFSSDAKRSKAIEFLRNLSENRTPVLIIADNLDFARKSVWDFLLDLPERCSAIATSREVPKDVPIIEKFRVRELVEEEARLMLYLYADIWIDSESAKEIVKLTGGVPAAIEFAASNIKDPEIGVRGTIKNLEKWPSKDLTTRFDFTYEPLGDEMKRFLWLISVAPSHFHVENFIKNMCEAKLSDDDQPPFGERWEKLWNELVRRRQWVRPSFLEDRYEMHPVVRDYIQHKAKDVDPDTFDSFERRFVKVMWGIANYLRSQLQAEEAAWFVFVAAVEHDNLLGAQRIAREKGMWQEVLDLAYDLNELFTRSGHWSDRWEVLKNGIKAARNLNKQEVEGMILNNLGNLAMAQGRYDEAKEYYEKSLRIDEELGDKKGIARALGNLGNLAMAQGRYDEAKEYYEKLLRINKEFDTKEGMALTLNNLATLADDLNKPELAFRFTAIALFLFASMKHVDAQKALRNLVRYAQKLGYDEKKLKAEGDKIVQEFNRRGFELVDELLRELEKVIEGKND